MNLLGHIRSVAYRTKAFVWGDAAHARHVPGQDQVSAHIPADAQAAAMRESQLGPGPGIGSNKR